MRTKFKHIAVKEGTWERFKSLNDKKTDDEILNQLISEKEDQCI
jgi:hypothetical protein